jgi:acyl-CoA thioesterase
LSAPHPLDTALLLTSAGEHRYRGATSPAYANMVGPYGGTTAALLLRAALLHPERIGEPIALTVNFAAPIADGAFEVEAHPARTNRSTQHWTLTLTQQGAVAATGSAVFALRRETWSASEATPPDEMPPPDTLPRQTTTGRPVWVARYDMRFTEGAIPSAFDGNQQPHSASHLWVRDEPPRPLDFESLAALCDCFFPRIFIRRRKFTPIGTVSLTTYFHADKSLLDAQGERHVLGTAKALSFRNGYFDQTAEVWSDAGQLLASTHQMVYYRE